MSKVIITSSKRSTRQTSDAKFNFVKLHTIKYTHTKKIKIIIGVGQNNVGNSWEIGSISLLGFIYLFLPPSASKNTFLEYIHTAF